MGKQAKKKDPKLKADKQRRHNRGTKGNNSRKRGPLWSIRQYKTKDEDGKEVTKVAEVRVPLGVGWNPELLGKKVREQGLPEPYDALHLDWADEMREYVHELSDQEGVRAKVTRTNLDNGRYNYEVIRKVGNDDEEVLWSIESHQNLNFGSAGKFSKKR
jgi:hypothetical protein